MELVAPHRSVLTRRASYLHTLGVDESVLRTQSRLTFRELESHTHVMVTALYKWASEICPIKQCHCLLHNFLDLLVTCLSLKFSSVFVDRYVSETSAILEKNNI